MTRLAYKESYMAVLIENGEPILDCGCEAQGAETGDPPEEDATQKDVRRALARRTVPQPPR